MKLNIRRNDIAGIWVGIFMLSIVVGCTNKGRRSDADSFEKLYQHLEQLSADSPEQVSQTIDSVMPSFKDSVMYYRLLLLKVRTCFLTFNLDSASIYLDRVLSFCERNRAYKGCPVMGTRHGSLFAYLPKDWRYATWVVVSMSSHSFFILG